MVGKEEQTVRLAAQFWSLPERQQARLPAQHCLAGLESWCQESLGFPTIASAGCLIQSLV